jgi:SNF2 family DNA or RNA helicase
MSQDIAVALLRAVDANLIGHAEAGQAAGLTALLKTGHPLTVAQVGQATRILSRYADKIIAAGIDLPVQAYPAFARGGDTRTPVSPPAQAQPGPNTPIIRVRWITTNAGKETERRENRLAVANAFRFKDQLKALPDAKPHKDGEGFVWHYSPTPAAIAAVMGVVGSARPVLSAKAQALLEAFNGQDDARAVLDELAPLPVFETSTLVHGKFALWGHQRRAVEFAARMTASLLAIPMGGGKTLSTITLANRLVERVEAQALKRVLIVCPNSVRGVWPREVRKFSAKTWHIVNGMKPSKRARKGVVDIAGAGNRLAEAEGALFDCRCGADVHAAVVNYDILAREPWKSWHPALPIDLLVYDEIHKLKAHGGQISKTCAKWVSWSHKRVGLSGTPMPQTPLDIFGVYRALDPAIFGLSWTLFRSRFAITNPHIEQQVVGYKNMTELAGKFFSIAYRPTIDLDLPPVVDVTRECVLEPEARKIYDSIDQEMWANLDAFTGSPRADVTQAMSINALGKWIGVTMDVHRDPFVMENLSREERRELIDHRFAELGVEEILDGYDESADSRTVTPANIMVRLLRLQQLTGGTVIDDDGARVRVSHAKQKLFAEVLDEVGCSRDTGAEPEPVIVFCRFRSDLDAAAEVAREKGLTYGEVSGRSKTGLTADSEMADYDVVGVQIQSGGTGVDLTRARVGIWFSLGYSLSDYDQARKRMDRPGQTRSVTFVHLLAQDTADADVYAALDGRRSVIHGVMEAHEIDATTLGFREEIVSADGEHGDGKAVAVTLPFERLIEAENARIGEPMRSMA